MRIARIAIAAVSILSFAVACYGEGRDVSTPQVRKITGTVSQVSFVHEFLVVICEEGYVKFHVPEGVTIMCGTKTVALDDIDTEDSVIVQFTTDEKGEKTAVAIRDNTVKRDY